MQNKLAVKIIAISALVMISLLVVVIAAILSYNFAIGQSFAQQGTIASSQNSSSTSQENNQEPIIQEDINIMILGIDEHNLADIFLIAHYSPKRNTLDIISLPRDTRMQFSDAQRVELMERGVRNPTTYRFLANSLVNRTGGRNPQGFEFATGMLGDMLGMEIHHYITMHIDGFRAIVDAVGGISMYVPQRLLYRGIWLEEQGRFDPGEIHIDIAHGYQLLNGLQAEQVVRFRHHPRGDFFRIEMQQSFMQAFFEQALNLEALTNNPLALATSIITHMNTDIGIHDIDTLIRQGAIDALNPDSIAFHTLPNHRSGAMYLLTEPDAQDMIASILDGSIHIPQEEPEEHEQD